ncbi:hypothetical protein HUJ04_003604 [Dendroctonus ponderosae]|nr:hypothetical protein HUJ04_003604 [Dendroctonus ponderosae]
MAQFFTSVDLDTHRATYKNKYCKYIAKLRGDGEEKKKRRTRTVKKPKQVAVTETVDYIKDSSEDGNVFSCKHCWKNSEIDKGAVKTFYEDYALLRPDVDPFLTPTTDNPKEPVAGSSNNNTDFEVNKNLSLHCDNNSQPVKVPVQNWEQSSTASTLEKSVCIKQPPNLITNASTAVDDDRLETFTSCFVSLVDVLKHPNTMDSKQEDRKKYSCYICFEKFSTNESLNQHKTQHKNDHHTDEDNERIEENNGLEVPKVEDSQEHNHANLKPPDLDSSEANFGCLACNVTFQDQSDIKVHFHNTNKCKYLCKICKRYFSMKGGFMVHILKHTSVSEASQEITKLPFKCKQCDDSFEERSDLMRHHVTVHSIAHNPIESDVPDVQLNNYKADPSNPITGTFPIFDCGICYDVFASEKTLIRHQEMHKQIALIPKEEHSGEDFDVQVVQNDCRVTPHDIISNFTISPAPAKRKAPHPKKASLRSIAPQDCIENRASPPLHFVKNPSKPVEKVTRTFSANKLVPNDSVLNPVVANQSLQFVNVTNPGLTTTQASLPQTGQSYILINPNNYPVGAVNPTINSMNPIPHLVSHGSATAITSINSMTNPNLLINSDGNPVNQATFINSLNEFSTIEPGKPLYFLVPANQQAAEKQKSAVASTSVTGGPSCSWMPKLAPVSDKRTNRNRSKRHFNENLANNLNMGMPYLNVGSTIQISDDDDVNSLQDNSDMIMPIITSFGTVPDDSGHKKPKTTEPATEYESEFQKFLKDGLNKNKIVCLGPPPPPRPKISMPKVDPTEIATASQAGDPLAHVGVSRKSLSEVKEPDRPVVVPISPDTDPLSCDQPSSSANSDIGKPKIFVKKLTDLIDASKKPSETDMPDLFCVLCNLYFNRWLNFKNHMEQQHHKFSCKFFKCEMFDDVSQLVEHMKNHRLLFSETMYPSFNMESHLNLMETFDCQKPENMVASSVVDQLNASDELLNLLSTEEECTAILNNIASNNQFGTLSDFVELTDVQPLSGRPSDIPDMHAKATKASEFTCDICRKVFATKKLLKKHLMRHNELPAVPCETCGKVFMFRYEMIAHSRSHSGPSFQCDICSKKFKHKSNLNAHKKRHLEQFTTFCDICSKGFISQHECNRHKNSVHMANGGFVCDTCGQILRTSSALKEHMEIHNRQSGHKMEHICNVCNISYSTNRSLKEHYKKIHSQRKQYVCSICGKSLSSKSTLETHIKMHTGLKDFHCIICKKLFASKGYLQIHQRIHTGYRPFQCTICPKSFMQKTSLTEHLRYHTGERPYRCECGRNFISKSHLMSHYKTHDVGGVEIDYSSYQLQDAVQ